MGLPWGFHATWDQYYQFNLLIRNDGSSTFEAGSAEDWMKTTDRSGHSSNRRQFLAGTSSPWIPPSSYAVATANIQNTQGMFVTDYGNAKNYNYRILPGGIATGCHDGVATAENSMWSSFGSPGALWQTNARNRADTEALLKLKDQKVNFGEALATVAQTAEMLVSSTVTLLKGLNAIKRGQFGLALTTFGLTKGQLVKRRGTVSNRYLEYVYGWKPLMQDIYSSWELMKEQLPKALIMRASREITSSLEFEVAGLNPNNHPWSYRLIERATAKNKTVLYAKMKSQFMHDIARAGLTNPLSVAWELVPYSFVVDWILPVGNVISALDATYGLDFVGGYRSQRTRGGQACLAETLPPTPGNWPLTVEVAASQVSIKDAYMREALAGFPAPMPYYKNPLSTVHVTEALALLRNL